MKQLRSTILMSVMIGVFIANLTPSASAGESALDFRVSPSADSSLAEGGDYFVLPLEPGDRITQSVQLSNPSSQPLDVRLAAADAATAQMGGVDYGAEQAAPESTGTWIALEHEKVRLDPGDSAEVDFEVAAPSDAASGTHLAGIVVWVEGEEARAVQGASATMNVQSRRVIAVQIELPGAAAPVLEIRGAEAEARPDGIYLGIELFNSGNGFAEGTGSVSIEGRNGQGTFLVDTIVPRTGTIYPFHWSGSSVPSGTYAVSVEIDYGVRIVTWEGEVVVGTVVQDDLRGRGVGGGDPADLRMQVAIGAILLLIAAAGFLFRRRLSSGGLPVWLPRISVSRAPKPTLVSAPAPTPRSSMRVAAQLPSTSALPVPRSEEVRRRVPPPPPPPPARLAPPPPPPPAAGRAA